MPDTSIYNIAVNPCGIGGTETFSRTLMKHFPEAETLTFRRAATHLYEAPYTLLKKSFIEQIKRALPFVSDNKKRLYKFPDISNSTIILNAPCDLDFIPENLLKNNRCIYLVHNEPSHIWNHKNYFGSNRDFRVKAMQQVDKVVCLSDEYIQPLADKLQLPVSRFTAITHTVELEPVHKAKEFQKKIIAICRIDQKQKRFDRIVEIAKELPDYKFEIYGTGKDTELLLKMLQESDNIQFKGKTSDVPGVHAQAGIFLMTSDFEGLSIAILESLSQGTPVVIAKNSFAMAKKIITNYSNGFVLEDFNVEEAVTAIEEISQNYRSYSKNAIDSFAPYSSNSFITQWKQIFKEL